MNFGTVLFVAQLTCAAFPSTRFKIDVLHIDADRDRGANHPGQRKRSLQALGI